jgi:hypothetical protein
MPRRASEKSGQFKPKEDLIPLGDTTEPETEIAKRIDKTFRVWNRVLDNVVSYKMYAAICSGAASCGKSHTTEEKLREQLGGEDNENYLFLKGSSSAVDLYKTLFEYRHPGQILVFDDCDSIWFNIECLNVLKAGLDTKRKRVVSWNKESWALRNPSEKTGEHFPNSFTYEGSAIVLSNIDLKAEVAKRNRFSKHIEALIERGVYLDLGIHTKRELFVRMWQVMKETPFLNDNEIPVENARKILTWIKNNLHKIERPSLRAVTRINTWMNEEPETWEETAECTLFSR